MNGFARVIEITPTYIGNPVLGFYKWPQKGEEIFRLSQSVTMSAAAVEGKLSGRFHNYAPHIFVNKDLSLSDGGFSENLAALPLIRRGVKNVIIVDAEHDPYYEFEGYKTLQGLLLGMGVEFCVPEIEKFMEDQKGKKPKKRSMYSAASVSVGSAKSLRVSNSASQIDSRIYYIKMSRPSSIFPSDPTANVGNSSVEKEELVKNRNDAYLRGAGNAKKRDKLVEPKCPKCDYYCDGAISSDFNSDFNKDMYTYLVNNYSEFMDSKKLRRFINNLLPAFLVSNFPQATTADQSFYRDQLEAFVGLGYLQASELNPALLPINSNCVAK